MSTNGLGRLTAGGTTKTAQEGAVTIKAIAQAPLLNSWFFAGCCKPADSKHPVGTHINSQWTWQAHRKV
jgi:hypothetical protein